MVVIYIYRAQCDISVSVCIFLVIFISQGLTKSYQSLLWSYSFSLSNVNYLVSVLKSSLSLPFSLKLNFWGFFSKQYVDSFGHSPGSQYTDFCTLCFTFRFCRTLCVPYVSVCVYKHVCVHMSLQEPTEDRRGWQSPCNWSYRWL